MAPGRLRCLSDQKDRVQSSFALWRGPRDGVRGFGTAERHPMRRREAFRRPGLQGNRASTSSQSSVLLDTCIGPTRGYTHTLSTQNASWVGRELARARCQAPVSSTLTTGSLYCTPYIGSYMGSRRLPPMVISAQDCQPGPTSHNPTAARGRTRQAADALHAEPVVDGDVGDPALARRP